MVCDVCWGESVVCVEVLSVGDLWGVCGVVVGWLWELMGMRGLLCVVV